ncbi:MAG: DUF3810 family protein [Trueperaceae bacterium]|nr:MAG: DUF3810 family protein [Trueperaceae bacterium]
MNRLFARLLLIASSAFVTLCTVASPPEAWVEQWYARTTYPAFNRLFVSLTAPLPFSLTSIFIALFIISLFGGLIYTLLFRRSERAQLGSWLKRGLIVALFVGTWFYLTWGLNYKRSSIEDLLALPQTDVATEEVLALAAKLGAVIDATASSPVDVDRATLALSRSLERYVEELTGTSLVLPSRVKTLPKGTLMSFGYAGFTSPFFLEAHIDAALPPASAVAVGAHELAHLAGFAGEADADLVTAIAGLNAPHPYARYTIALQLFAQVANELSEEHRHALVSALPERGRQDLVAMHEATERYYRKNLARPLNRLYDRYLRSQGVEDGVQDYGRVVTLLVHFDESEEQLQLRGQ